MSFVDVFAQFFAGLAFVLAMNAEVKSTTNRDDRFRRRFELSLSKFPTLWRRIFEVNVHERVEMRRSEVAADDAALEASKDGTKFEVERLCRHGRLHSFDAKDVVVSFDDVRMKIKFLRGFEIAEKTRVIKIFLVTSTFNCLNFARIFPGVIFLQCFAKRCFLKF